MSIWDLTEEEKANMRRAGWSDQAIELFELRDQLGDLKDADVCHTSRTKRGEAVRFYIRIENEKIIKVKYSYQACPAVAATCSAIAKLAISKTIDEAESVIKSSVWEMLGSLPDGHDDHIDFVLRTFRETVKIYKEQKRLTKKQHKKYLHICGLTGRQLEELETIPCDDCPWVQNCENSHIIIDTTKPASLMGGRDQQI